MCHLHAHALSHSKISEVLSTDVEKTECIVEEAVSHILVDLFDEVIVDDVTIYSSSSQAGEQSCSIEIRAECCYDSCRLLPCSKEYMELVTSKCIGSLLKELFGPVTVDCVIVQPSVIQSRL